MRLGDNYLLSKVPDDELERLVDAFKPVQLKQGQSLHEPMQVIDRFYFLTKGFSSEIAIDGSGQRIEVGCLGHEGFAGVPAVLGVDRSPHHSFMETDGEGFQIPVALLTGDALGRLPTLRQLMHSYVHVFMMQVAATALADGRYNIAQRTARWLLMAHDRLRSDELPLTHEFLALMLGVRRSSVTTALHVVEGEGAIKATRRLITIKSRDLLEKLAGASYGLPEAEYRRLIS